MDALLDLELLRTFVVVAQTGELKKTAHIIHRSQAAVSMQIKRLETQLGQRLMQRNNQGIRLTAAGETLLSYSEQFLSLNNATLSALSSGDINGTLNIGIPTDYAQDFLHYFMPVLTNELPNLTPRITCHRSRHLRELLTTGALDIAIVSGEPNKEDAQLLWSEPMIWAAPDGIALEERLPVPIALYEDSCIVRDTSLQALEQSAIQYNTVFTSPVIDNIATAVHHGMAISLLPASSLLPYKTRHVSALHLHCQVVLKMNLICRDNIEPSTQQRLGQCFQLAAEQRQKQLLQQAQT